MENKILKNKERDRKVINIQLRQEGWRVVRIWEHNIKKNSKKTANGIIKILLKQAKYEK